MLPLVFAIFIATATPRVAAKNLTAQLEKRVSRWKNTPSLIRANGSLVKKINKITLIWIY